MRGINTSYTHSLKHTMRGRPKKVISNFEYPLCRVCNGRIEKKKQTYEKWLNTKTCSRDCYRKYFVLERNSNWKGLDIGNVRCCECGVKCNCSGHYSYGKKLTEIRCKNCFDKGMVGIYPEHLKPFIFEKGQIAWNKII